MKKGSSPDERKQILNKLQTKLRGKFGDPDLFLWLAEDGREHLWKEADLLALLVKLNTAQRILEKRKSYALMTFADARLHPRWAMFEAPGGTNLRKYALEKTERGLQVKIPLLTVTGDRRLVEREFTISLAPSGQLSDLDFFTSADSHILKYHSAHQDFEGVPGGAEILFHRQYLEHSERATETILHSGPGPTWLKLTLDVQSKAPTEWLDGKGRITTPAEVHHFNTSLSKKSKHADKLEPGLRVLSVDLGLRTFASCSVFELVKGKPEKGLCFPTEDDREIGDPGKLWAKHERSFKLCLPGEIPTRGAKEGRNKGQRRNPVPQARYRAPERRPATEHC